MKKFLVFQLIIIQIFFFVGCKKQDTSNLLDSNIKNYYLQDGFVLVKVPEDLQIFCDEKDATALFDDGTLMIKKKTYVKIQPTCGDFVLANGGVYLDISNGVAFNKITINGKIKSLTQIDINAVKIANITVFHSHYTNIFPVGVACYLKNTSESAVNFDYLDGDIFSTSAEDRVFYAYLDKNTEFENISKDSIETNITFDLEKSLQNGKINLDFTFELMKSELFEVFAIFEDDEENFYFLPIQKNSSDDFYKISSISSAFSNLDSITLHFSDDIETKEIYEK